ncbi:glutaminyl-peptide cyclotransferase [Gilvimarinus chinensis]|uniref:glutaminyl-peptide cyclotransferase n=1 Tax=Gilvimarinus chinensis TaxID=396005 RepID=UPI0003A05D48|nr:glutaminyl-peptide cyclotransferase [Gilvimarinus chinensis]
MSKLKGPHNVSSIMSANPYRLFFLFFSTLLSATSSVAAPPQLNYQIIDVIARDTRPFTQGLEFDGNQLIESSGLRGRSYVVKTSLPNQQNTQTLWHTPLPAPYFAEGLSQVNGRIYLLSWQQQKGWIIHPDTGSIESEFTYTGQGWGLTAIDNQLVRSDGSHILYWHSTNDFSELKKLEVTWSGQPVKRLNELEYSNGLIWANIWQSSFVVAIHPISGSVVGWVDLTELTQREAQVAADNVLNGIAYHEASNTFWLTGKRWHHYYRLKIQQPYPLSPDL